MIKFFFENTWSFLKALLSIRIYWKYNLIRSNQCKIDKKAKIHPPYNLNIVNIGKGTYVASNSRISSTVIGNYCSIGPNLCCGYGIHPMNGISTSPLFYSTKKPVGYTFSKTDKVVERKKIIIGSDVFIGTNVTILDGVTIGDGAVIGAGAIVSKDIPPYAVAIGVPIKIIKYRFSEKVIGELLKIKWWELEETDIQNVEKYFFEVQTFIEEYSKRLRK